MLQAVPARISAWYTAALIRPEANKFEKHSKKRAQSYLSAVPRQPLHPFASAAPFVDIKVRPP